MRIDRHNYEEYFLLYVDNELTVDQKKQVEQFVKENPDLEEELVMLQQSRLIPDHTIVFEGKDLLIKEENNSFINLGNYEEWLVLYVDDELNPDEKTAVEKFAASHPHVRAELDLFLQIKLQPEELKFSNKKILYRKETKVKVLSVTWWRVAAAAMLIIAAGITTYSVITTRNNASDNRGIAAKKEQPPVKPLSPEQGKQQDQVVANSKDKQQVAVVTPNSNKLSKQKPSPRPATKQQFAENSSNENSVAQVEELKRRPEIISDREIQESKESQISVATAPVDRKQFINGPIVTNQSEETPDDYASNTENKRLRGIFRKATRFIERTSGINPANSDDKVLIGAMAVNLK